MQVREIIDRLGLEVLNLSDGEREVTGGYTGDLLSWVMGRAESRMLWVTIMTNVNILAVASLRDLPAVLIAEGAEIAPEVVAKAAEQEITLLRSPKAAYTLCVELGRLLD
ncbi:MAG: AraC family transcriptional regulator [Clostridia bacterium]|nr:AraC family transcriptional regulator [Clostridia bacterium]